MGRKKEWPAEIERAAIAEVFLGGRQVREVVADINAGRLEGLEACPVPESTVYRWVDTARRNQPPPDDFQADDVETELAELWSLYHQSKERVQVLTAKADENPYARQAEGLARAQKELAKFLREIAMTKRTVEAMRPKPAPTAPEPATDTAEEPEQPPVAPGPPSFLESLDDDDETPYAEHSATTAEPSPTTT